MNKRAVTIAARASRKGFPAPQKTGKEKIGLIVYKRQVKKVNALKPVKTRRKTPKKEFNQTRVRTVVGAKRKVVRALKALEKSKPPKKQMLRILGEIRRELLTDLHALYPDLTRIQINEKAHALLISAAKKK
jgi:hypothetical protein